MMLKPREPALSLLRLTVIFVSPDSCKTAAQHVTSLPPAPDKTRGQMANSHKNLADPPHLHKCPQLIFISIVAVIGRLKLKRHDGQIILHGRHASSLKFSGPASRLDHQRGQRPVRVMSRQSLNHATQWTDTMGTGTKFGARTAGRDAAPALSLCQKHFQLTEQAERRRQGATERHHAGRQD
ncbi:hypothetical protein BaRGS_00014846 [Batillaria attramentaria]|uniref:Secreted protein n=1 Tax=Batillaria attramentaria TaxID=370345 RepID=A0ABD0L349_9CAEN